MTKELSPEVCIEFRNADKGDRYVDMAWLDLTVPWEELQKQLDTAMRNAPLKMNEFPCDYAITEVNDMCGLQFAQYEKLEHVHMLAQLVVKHGAAFALWFEQCRPGLNDKTEQAFLDVYIGPFSDDGDYAYEVHKDSAWYKAIPLDVADAIDWKAVEIGLESASIWKVYRDCVVHVFRSQRT